MGKYCCVVGCRLNSSRGKNAKQDDDLRSVSFFSFPSDPCRRRQWIHALRRDQKTFTVTKNTTVCSLHFPPSAFHAGLRRRTPGTSGVDTGAGATRRRKVVDDAVPTIFPPLYDKVLPQHAKGSKRKEPADSSGVCPERKRRCRREKADKEPEDPCVDDVGETSRCGNRERHFDEGRLTNDSKRSSQASSNLDRAGEMLQVCPPPSE